jgi:hypothetical protein
MLDICVVFNTGADAKLLHEVMPDLAITMRDEGVLGKRSILSTPPLLRAARSYYYPGNSRFKTGTRNDLRRAESDS